MADITILDDGRQYEGARRTVYGTYTGPNPYAAGGDSITPSEVGLGVIQFLHFENPVDATPTCRLVTFDHANGKAIWFDPADGTELGAVDLSGYSCRFRAFGY